MGHSDIKVLVINANPKTKGTLYFILEDFSTELSRMGVNAEIINLVEHKIGECIGCLECIKGGGCSVKDDMGDIIQKMRKADGYIIGSSIRDGYTTALFKRFCERTSYLLGFTRDLLGKPTVGVATVGYMGGRRQAANLLGMGNCGARRLAFLYERVGFEKRVKNPGRLKLKINRITASLVREAHRTKKNGKKNRLRLEDVLFRIFVVKMKKHLPYIYHVWQDKGWIG